MVGHDGGGCLAAGQPGNERGGLRRLLPNVGLMDDEAKLYDNLTMNGTKGIGGYDTYNVIGCACKTGFLTSGGSPVTYVRAAGSLR